MECAARQADAIGSAIRPVDFPRPPAVLMGRLAQVNRGEGCTNQEP